MKTYQFTLPQPLRYFEVEAETQERAKEILENCKDITKYEFDDNEVWQPDFEPLN